MLSREEQRQLSFLFNEIEVFNLACSRRSDSEARAKERKKSMGDASPQSSLFSLPFAARYIFGSRSNI